jgi:mono/diheme cytochrome c family protein
VSVRVSGLSLLVAIAGCGEVPLEQPAATVADRARTWTELYATHCAGCHGADGTLGAARPMRDADYMNTVPQLELERVVREGQGKLMPALGTERGGPLAPEQVHLLVSGMLETWGKDGQSGPLPWSAPLGDAAAGAGVYATFCQGCHGAPDGLQPGSHGSVSDPNYLRLVSDQGLRSAVLFGRADLGGSCHGPYPGQPADRRLDAGEVANVVAFLSGKRPQFGRKDS